MSNNRPLSTDKNGYFVGQWQRTPGLTRRLWKGEYRRMRLELGGWEYATEKQVAAETLRHECDPVPHGASYNVLIVEGGDYFHGGRR